MTTAQTQADALLLAINLKDPRIIFTLADRTIVAAELCRMLDRIAELEEQTQPEREPLFWVRLLRDGLYEGPVHANSADGKMLREAKPGEWHPLYLGQADLRPHPTPFPADFAQAYWRDRSGAPDL